MSKLSDFGEKIGGARKDLRGKITLADFVSSDLTSDEKTNFNRKEFIWPTPDYEKMLEDGVEPQAIRAIRVVRDTLPGKPAYAHHGDEYLNVVAKLRDTCMALKTADQAKHLYANPAVGSGVLWTISRDATYDYDRSFGFNYSTHNQAGDALGRDASTLVQAVIGLFSDKVPRKTPLARELKLNPAWPKTAEPYKKLLAKLGLGVVPASWSKRAANGFVVGWSGSDYLPGGSRYNPFSPVHEVVFKTEAEAVEAMNTAAKACHESKVQVTQAKRTATITRALGVAPNERGAITAVGVDGTNPRVGPTQWVEGSEISSAPYMDTLGLRGGEFGNWLNDGDREKVLVRGYEGFVDMMEVMGLPPQAVSLDRSLAIAFGARGHGTFAAHYEYERRVINLTKPSGAGCLAHEWGHGLDHYLHGRAILHGLVNRGYSGPPMMSEVVAIPGMWNKNNGDAKVPEVGALNAIAESMARIFKIKEQKSPEAYREQLVRGLERETDDFYYAMATARNHAYTLMERNPGKGHHISITNDAEQARAMAEMDEAVAPFVEKVRGGSPLTHEEAEMAVLKLRGFTGRVAQFQTAVANWITNAVRHHYRARQELSSFDQQMSSGTPVVPVQIRDTEYQQAVGKLTEYYARPREMFARCFESCIADELQKAGRVSPFLVGPTNGEAYPKTEDRQAFAQLFLPAIQAHPKLARRIVAEIAEEDEPLDAPLMPSDVKNKRISK